MAVGWRRTLKYALPEFERRFLVEVPPEPLSSGVFIEDLYLEGTRMRLRRMTPEDGGPTVLKLGKKYGRVATATEPIVNIYLSPEEFDLFEKLPGYRLAKTRHRHEGFAVDVFRDLPLILAEVEASSFEDLMAVPVPNWAIREVTGEAGFEGANLARFGLQEIL